MERDSRSQIQPADAVIIRRSTPGESGITTVSDEQVMRLPQWRSVFTAIEPAGILPEGMTMVDTTKVDPQGENPHVIVAGETVGGEHTIPLENGVGAVTLEPGVEVVVNAKALTKRLGGQGRGLSSSPTERGIKGLDRARRAGW